MASTKGVVLDRLTEEQEELLGWSVLWIACVRRLMKKRKPCQLMKLCTYESMGVSVPSCCLRIADSFLS